jgi:hypothetical protein
MDNDDDVPGWNGMIRPDLMEVVLGAESRWIIRPPDTRPPIRLCPCCWRPFHSQRTAKLVANAMYPLAEAP